MSQDLSVQLPQQVFVVSDGTGGTAEKVVRAACRQFRGHVVHLRTIAHVERAEKLTALFKKAQRTQGMVVSTLVHPAMRDLAFRLSADLSVRHVDLIGNLLDGLEAFFEMAPVGVPGLLHRADANYFKRIEAVEFTVKADDGKDPRMLRDADIVLIGVSRTSKTPLSTFLAHKGFKVGNVPIVLDKAPPEELFEVDQGRVFALTIDPESLEQIRRSRMRAMGVAKYAHYADSDYILAELEYAMELYRSNPRWPIIDVTNRAIEETAATILTAYHENGFQVPEGDVSQL